MVAFVVALAEQAGITNVRFMTEAAERISLADDSLELITIGNAFHRLHRETIAANALRWLKPGGHLALLWGGNPLERVEAEWATRLRTILLSWMEEVQAAHRLPVSVLEARPPFSREPSWASAPTRSRAMSDGWSTRTR